VSKILHNVRTLIAPESGVVKRVGAQVSGVEIGERVLFTRRWVKLLDSRHYLVLCGEIQASIL
jgi:hypothetical protein